MADVGKVKGDIQPPEPEKSRQTGRDLDAIKKKWERVGKVDEDQRKQQKPKAQEEAEKEAEQMAVPHQGLEKEPAHPSLYEPQGRGVSIPEVEGGYPSYPTEERPYFGETTIEQGSQPPQREDHRHAERRREPQRVPPKKKVSKKAITPKKVIPSKKVKEKKATAHLEKPKKALPPIKIEKKVIPKEEKKEPVKQAEEAAETITPPPPLPLGSWEMVKEEEKKQMEEKEGALPPITLPTEATPTGAAPPEIVIPTPPVSSPYATLPLPIHQLFDRMVGVMTVMHEGGISETTLHLDNPQFAKSIFYGAQITIKEFSTAPKAFNIEFLGSEEATALIAEHAEELVAAFQEGKYNYTVNRIQTGYLSPTTEVRRREARRVKRKKT